MIPSGGRHEPQPDDPLLESLLDEVLGGNTPPDLGPRILAQRDPPVFDRSTVAPPPTARRPLAPPVQWLRRADASSSAKAAGRRAQLRHTRRRIYRVVQTVLLTAGILLLVVLWQLAPWNSVRRARDTLAVLPAPDTRVNRIQQSDEQPLPPAPQASETVADQPVESPVTGPGPRSNVKQPPTQQLAQTDSDELTRGAQRPASPAAASDSLPVVERINQHLQRAWQLAQVEPSPPVSDEDWCRCVYRRLLGRRSSDEETAAFLRQDVLRRRELLVERLLTEPRYQDEYVDHWATIWASQLLSSEADGAPSTQTFRVGLQHYLREALSRNHGFDQIVLELLSAEGSNSVNEDDYHGATNYLLALSDERGIRPTTEVCRVLLGQRVQCAQCHDDVQSGLRQDQFWQLTAFFRQMHIRSLGAGRLRLTDRDFAGDLVQTTRQPGAVGYQRADGSWEHVYPTFPDGQTSDSSGRVQDARRRQQLARWLVTSREFPRAVVNRLWSQFFYYGFTLPVDDMGRHNPAAHPELLDLLADEFVATGCDLKQLTRWIVLSDPFARSRTLTQGNSSDAPHAGAVARFSRRYHRPASFSDPSQALAQLMRGENDSADIRSKTDDNKIVIARRTGTFTGKAGDSQPVDPTAAPNATGTAGQQPTIGQLRLARSLAASSMPAAQKVEHVFRVVLGRPPRAEESEQAARLHESLDDDPVRTLEGLFWALNNTAEFAQEH